MSIMSALALYGIIWFMTMFLVLPIRMKSQADAGEVVPGTHASAPSDAQMWHKVKIVTAIATLAFVVIVAVILSEIITYEMIENLTRWMRGMPG
jgi:predicted secreted protein